jgi:membrane protease YdiL (CAAX protease family)
MVPGTVSRVIAAPPRSSTAGTVIVLTVVAVLSLTMVLPDTSGKWTLAALIILMPLAILSKAIHAIHITILALTWLLLVGLVPPFQLWPLSILAPLVGYAVVVLLTPSLRHSVGWLRKGLFGSDIRLLVIATIAVSSAALVAWVLIEEPDLGHHLALIPEMPLWLYPLAAVGFACLNAAMEEAVFRGIMMEALDSAMGEGLGSIAAQAVSFAALHYVAGFPNGVSGFAMTLLYGLMLGIVRRRSRGMLAPWVAHVAADIVIFAVLSVIVLR